MTTERKCRAKTPATCKKHGNRQLGVQAFHQIVAVVDGERRVALTRAQMSERPVKSFSSVQLTSTLLAFARDNKLDAERIGFSIKVAAELHQKDLRAQRGPNPKVPYIEHPLRNAVRLSRWGCKDQDVLIAAVLHDTVEDHPLALAQKNGQHSKQEELARVAGFDWYRQQFGVRATRITEGMSNEIADPDWDEAQKNESYVGHVKDAIKDPDVLVCKVADLLDNGGSLHHNIGKGLSEEGISRRARKYLLVWDIVQDQLRSELQKKDLTVPVTREGGREMLAQMQRAHKRLLALAA
jgi:hypothetical protein